MLKSTGIVRKIDTLGRLVLPKELRNVLEIGEKDPIEVFTDGNSIVLRKYAPGCSLCGSSERPITNLYPDKKICIGCVDIISTKQQQLIKEAK